MKRLWHHTLLAASFAAALFCASTALVLADDDDDKRDQELARQALAEGRVRPLSEIIESFKMQLPGEIVGIELKAKGANAFVYEFKVLTPDGKLKEVKVDALTSKIIKIEDDDD